VKSLDLMVERLIKTNDVASGHIHYTQPAPSVYPHQWLWDSCFSAIIWSHFDITRAQQELTSVVAKQITKGPDSGMIPHMSYWKDAAADFWGYPDRSNITQPPLVSVAAKIVYERGGSREWLAQLYPKLKNYHEWFDRRRDPDNDNLVSIIHPWESGWDASPRWDKALDLGPNPSFDELHEARVKLARQILRYDCDLLRIQRHQLFNDVPIDFNSIRAADIEALAYIAKELNHDEDSAKLFIKHREVAQAIESVLFTVHQSDLFGTNEKGFSEPSLASSLSLFGGCISNEQAKNIAQNLHTEKYWTKFPLSTTPINDDHFNPDIYWRGNTWVLLNWLIYKGFLRYGLYKEAEKLAAKTISMVENNGLWEYYHPLTGHGQGAKFQSWSGLVIDMKLPKN